MRREHGNAFNAQGPAVHDVVVIAFHLEQLAVANLGDHAAAARAEVAGGREFVDVRELQVLGCGLERGPVEEPADGESRPASDRQLQYVSAADTHVPRCSHGFLLIRSRLEGDAAYTDSAPGDQSSPRAASAGHPDV